MIYLIKSFDYLKIGYTDDITKRLNAFNTTNPDFTLLETKEGTRDDEKVLHKLCKPWSHRNEWFKDVSEVRKFWNDYQETTEYDVIKLKKEIEDLKNKLRRHNSTNFEIDLMQQKHEEELQQLYEEIIQILYLISKLLLENNDKTLVELIENIINFNNKLIYISKTGKLTQNNLISLCQIGNNLQKILDTQL